MEKRPLPPVEQAFFARLAHAPARVLITDYDGTLAPFRVERKLAFPYPGVREVLGRMMESGRTRVVVVSGRVAAEVRDLLGLLPWPEIWGSHGWERLWPDGRYEVWPLEPRVAEGLAQAKAWVEKEGLGKHCEVKPASLALHWRGLPQEEVGELVLKAISWWKDGAAAFGLELKEFEGGLELRAPGRNKGTAVGTLLAESPPESVIAYLGDDLTDEDAFAALEGRGLGVLVRREFRPTKAQAWLRPPEELFDFLNRWAQT